MGGVVFVIGVSGISCVVGVGLYIFSNDVLAGDSGGCL